MKIREALRTQASSLYSATPIGAPIHPAPIVMADRTRNKKSVKHNWLTMLGQHCLLAEGDIGAPILVKGLCSVRLTYFHANRLLTGLYKQETEIL